MSECEHSFLVDWQPIKLKRCLKCGLSGDEIIIADLRRQLAEAQAEVERLTTDIVRLSSFETAQKRLVGQISDLEQTISDSCEVCESVLLTRADTLQRQVEAMRGAILKYRKIDSWDAIRKHKAAEELDKILTTPPAPSVPCKCAELREALEREFPPVKNWNGKTQKHVCGYCDEEWGNPHGTQRLWNGQERPCPRIILESATAALAGGGEQDE